MSAQDNGYATKQDFAELREELKARDERMVADATAREDRMVADATGREDRIVETMRDIETHLVKEFINFVRSNDERVRSVESAETHAAQRLATLEMRVTELELKLLKIH
jgi:hypothetical protein